MKYTYTISYLDFYIGYTVYFSLKRNQKSFLIWQVKVMGEGLKGEMG